MGEDDDDDREMGTAQESSLEKGRKLDRAARLLQLCSHFSLQAREDATASKECERLRERLERNFSSHRSKLEQHLASAELLGRARDARAALRSGGTAPTSSAEGPKNFHDRIASLKATGEKHLLQVATTAEEALEQAQLTPNNSLFVRAVPAEVRAGKANDPAPVLTSTLRVFSTLPSAEEDDNLEDRLKTLRKVSESQHEKLLRDTWSSILKVVSDLKEAATKSSFFATTLSLLQEDAEQRSCSICLSEELPLHKLAITPCAHVFCVPCLRSSLSARPACPLCRTVIKAPEVQPLALELDDGTAETGADADAKVVGRFAKYGSKLSVVASTLQEVLKGDPTAKVVVFVQWHSLEVRVHNALKEFGINCTVLKGNVYTRTSAITDFQEPVDDTSHSSASRVLILSLEHSASGANLTAAHHVFFIHPMNATTEAQAVAYELQAIGRVRRWGQARDCVHVWRFVTLDTVEATLTQRHQQSLWKSFRKAGEASSSSSSSSGRQFEILERASIENFECLDDDDNSAKADDIEECRKKCLAGNFGGFIVHRGRAYFLRPTSKELRKRVKHAQVGKSLHLLILEKSAIEDKGESEDEERKQEGEAQNKPTTNKSKSGKSKEKPATDDLTSQTKTGKNKEKPESEEVEEPARKNRKTSEEGEKSAADDGNNGSGGSSKRRRK
mmetsp:Transcript_58240/g.127869  ORF Transcript_58240/g.127869 Transcript_58240/m.127869 type:complete len:675 (-) Transcript_58240:313-2337(-)